MEHHFEKFTTEDEIPPITLEFSASTLIDNFRTTNSLLVADSDLGSELTTLLNNAPPDADVLVAESSGVALISVSMQQTLAEFSGDCDSPGDETVIQGVEANLLRVANDFF